MKNEVRHVINSLSGETFRSVEDKVTKPDLLVSEPYFANQNSSIATDYYGRDMHAEGTEQKQRLTDQEVIILSDDETATLVSPKLVSSSFVKSNQPVSEDRLPQHPHKSLSSDELTESINSNVSRDMLQPFPSRIFNVSSDILEPFPSRIFAEESPVSSQEQESDVLDNKRVPSETKSSVSRNTASLLHSNDTDRQKNVDSAANVRDIGRSLKDSSFNWKGSSGQPIKHHSSTQILSSRTRKNGLELQKDDAVIMELVCDAVDDPLDRALDNFKRPNSVAAKSITTVPKRKVIQLQMPTNNKSGNRMGTGVRRLKPPRLDDWYRPILELDYFSIVGLSSGKDEKRTPSVNLKEIPLCFKSVEHYVEIFRPLVLEEFKAQLHSSYMETSPEDTCCGSLCILSVERIDDFHLIRGRPDDSESAASKGCSENDLVLLTREPLQNSAQDLHVLGKVLSFMWSFFTFPFSFLVFKLHLLLLLAYHDCLYLRWKGVRKAIKASQQFL